MLVQVATRYAHPSYSRQCSPGQAVRRRRRVTQPYRLREGGHIDRARALGFSYDGTPYVGYAGDTLASALIANGVHLVGRSFKYHRPRGIFTAGGEEPNAIV